MAEIQPHFNSNTCNYIFQRRGKQGVVMKRKAPYFSILTKLLEFEGNDVVKIDVFGGGRG